MKLFFNINKTLLICIYLTTSITLYSCHKAGTGGKSSVSGSVYHHSKLIPAAIVYIKYGATEFPGADVSVYDDHITADANAHYEFSGLRKGSYFLYGVGYDNAIFRTVTGGVGITLKNNQNLSSDVPVTE